MERCTSEVTAFQAPYTGKAPIVLGENTVEPTSILLYGMTAQCVDQNQGLRHRKFEFFNQYIAIGYQAEMLQPLCYMSKTAICMVT